MQTIAQLFDLTGRNAVVTGGATGIGKAIVMRLAEAGACVTIADIDIDEATRTVEEIGSAGGKVRAIQADVRSAADADKVIQTTIETFGSVHILVNNAGIYPYSAFLAITEDLWDKVLDINLKGYFLYSRTAAQAMAEAGQGGKIINICSIDALRPTGMVAHYNASKGGVYMLTKAMALELAPMKITVNAVAPGGIDTPGTDEVRGHLEETTGLKSEQIIEEFVKRVPVGRMGEPDDIAKVVLFLASGASDYVCGEMILVDGGNLLT
jgi:2-deoxy-D-gluconate 3-dehydrogenase